MGEGIRSGKEVAWDVDDFEIKICKVKQPLHLTEVCQVLVICKDLDGEGGSIEVMPPGFQSMDDYKELLVIDVVILFSWDEQLGEVGAGMPIAIGISLEEDGPRSVL